ASHLVRIHRAPHLARRRVCLGDDWPDHRARTAALQRTGVAPGGRGGPGNPPRGRARARRPGGARRRPLVARAAAAQGRRVAVEPGVRLLIGRLAAAAAGGASLYAAFPPLGWWPAAFVGPALLVVALGPLNDSEP